MTFMGINKILPKINRKYKQYKERAKYQEILDKNSIFYQSKAGKVCFIVGNGPSINSQDLTKLINLETFLMNSFWRHPQYKIIRPKYYLGVSLPHGLGSTQTLIWDQDFPGSNPVISSVPETKLFFSIAAKEFIEKNNLFPQNPIYYILQQELIDKSLNFNVDPTKPMPFTKNSALLTMLLAVNMGFETIYLLGCEHDFAGHPSGQAFTDFKHFYNEPPGAIPDYWANTRYEDILAGTLRLFQGYRFFKEKMAKSHPQVKVFNSTPNSFLDVFPYKKFEEIDIHPL